MTALLLLLGGSGERFGGDLPKQFAEIEYNDKKLPLFEVTARRLLAELDCAFVIFVASKKYLNTSHVKPVIESIQSDFPRLKVQYAAGGATRFASFLNGYRILARLKGIQKVVVHDANRPYLHPEFLQKVKHEVDQLSIHKPVCLPVIPQIDSTVRIAEERVMRYEKREELFRVQTPQLFHLDSLNSAFDRNALVAPGQNFSDEGSFALALGLPVFYFEGDERNIKVTYQSDLATMH